MKLDLRYKLQQAINAGSLVIFAPMMVLYCLHKGMDLYQVGLFFGAYFLAITCFELPSGAWADKFGRLKVFYYAKLFDCINFALLIYFDAIELIILASFIGGIGRALGSGTLEAWYVERLQEQQRETEIGRQLSSVHAWSLVAMAIGALIGTGLVHFFSEQHNRDNPYLFTLIAVFILHACILLSMPYFFQEGEGEGHSQEAMSSGIALIGKTLQVCWSVPVLQLVLLMQLLFGVLLTSTQTYWQPMLQSLLQADADILIFGLVSALFYLCAAVAAKLGKNRLSKSDKPLTQVIFSLLTASSLVLICMAFSQSVSVFIGLYWVFGLIIFAVKPLLATILHQQISDRYRATSLSLLSLVFNLGGMLVGLLFSLIADLFGIDVFWWLMAGVGLLTSLLIHCRYAVVTPTRLKQHRLIDPNL